MYLSRCYQPATVASSECMVIDLSHFSTAATTATTAIALVGLIVTSNSGDAEEKCVSLVCRARECNDISSRLTGRVNSNILCCALYRCCCYHHQPDDLMNVICRRFRATMLPVYEEWDLALRS